MRETIEFTVYDKTGDETVHKLPAKYIVCPNCDGCGTDRGASVECDGGGFTSSEWADQDDDFKQDYLAGVYDKTYGYCDGKRVVLIPNRDQIEPALLDEIDEAEQDERDYRAMVAAERRMGA